MNIDDINKQNFLILIEKYLDGKINLEDVKLLVNYYESYQKSHEWVEALGPEKTIKQNMLINILEAIQNEEKHTKQTPFYKTMPFYYAVAASLVLLLALPFVFNTYKSQKQHQIHLDTEASIKPGNNKAILTLEDGSVVALEKGKNFKSTHLESNGKELVYKRNTELSKKELVYNYLTVPRGGQYTILLSDGTEVWLNSASKLKYPVNFIEGNSREVELIYGEAYFDVSSSKNHSGSKFKVHNNNQDIEVLGTEFNVKAYPDENFIYTTLLEGSISLESAGLRTRIKPEEQAVFDKTSNNFVVYSQFDVDAEVAWKRGLFSFKDKSLKDIMKVLSRWYDIDVIFIDKQLENVRFKGVLSKNQNMEHILTLIKNTNFINAYEINKSTIILK